MTRAQLAALCLSLDSTYEDYPFDETWTVIRHKKTKKCFAFIYEREGLKINLKCEPMQADFLKRALGCILPAYHMNKEHWITAAISPELPEELLKDLIEQSYQLTL